MRIAGPAHSNSPKHRLWLWLRRGFDVLVIGAMALAVIETISYLTDLVG